MNRNPQSLKKRLSVLLLLAVVALTTLACRLPAIGNVGDAIKNMFDKIGF